MRTAHRAALEQALAYHAAGYTTIPLRPKSKRAAIRWKDYQDQPPSADTLRRWFARGDCNLALVTGKVIVIDCDHPDVVDLVQAHCGPTPMICQTPRGGFHLYYRPRQGVSVANRAGIKGRPIDLRARGGYAVAPPSRNAEGVFYRWVGEILPPARLPVFKVSWTRSRGRRYVREIADRDADPARHLFRARAYLATIEGAISGQGGHNRTFRVACVLTHKFGLSVADALPLFREWNETCEPPWGERELLHKLGDAARLRKR